MKSAAIPLSGLKAGRSSEIRILPGPDRNDKIGSSNLKFEAGANRLEGQAVIRLSGNYIPVLIAFLAACVLTGFGLGQQVYAADNDDEPEDSFAIEQEAGTSGGTTKRYIDISSAWSGAYIHENMTVEGKAEIRESFSMNNVKPGSGGSDNSSIGSGGSGENDNPDSEQGGGSSAADKNSGVESNPDSGEDNNPNPDSKPVPELEPLAVPEWVDLF